MRLASFYLFALAAISGCTPDTANQVEARKQEVVQLEAVRQTGLPNVVNFTERKFVKYLYELRDSEISTWVYKTNVEGRHILVGKGIGFPLSAAAQYSNPQKGELRGDSRVIVLPQAEPNGLFMPASAEGSWVMVMTPDGPKPYYSEDRLTATPMRIPGADESQKIPWEK